jgi:hypothetical protein
MQIRLGLTATQARMVVEMGAGSETLGASTSAKSLATAGFQRRGSRNAMARFDSRMNLGTV